jgi:type I restriction enzyme S subunit
VTTRMVTLGDICEFKYGKSLPAPARSGTGFDVFGSNGLVGKHEAAITNGPTIIVGRKGSLGELNFSDSECWPIDTTYYVDRTCTGADLRWLFHAMASLGLTGLNRAAAIPGLNRNDAYAKCLNLPSPFEQRRIAAILDKADALRAKRREAIAKLDQLLQSVFLEMFGDPVINPRCEVVELASVCERVTDGTHQSPNWSESGVPFLFQSNVKPGEISFETKKSISLAEYESLTARCRIEYGDVLYTIVGSYGNAAMVRTHEKFCFQRHIAQIKPKSSVLPEFLEAMMNQPSIKRQADEKVTGIAQKTLILKELKRLLVLAPTLGEQVRFRAFSDRVSQSRKLMIAQESMLADEFNSIQSMAFAGTL